MRVKTQAEVLLEVAKRIEGAEPDSAESLRRIAEGKSLKSKPEKARTITVNGATLGVGSIVYVAYDDRVVAKRIEGMSQQGAVHFGLQWRSPYPYRVAGHISFGATYQGKPFCYVTFEEAKRVVLADLQRQIKIAEGTLKINRNALKKATNQKTARVERKK